MEVAEAKGELGGDVLVDELVLELRMDVLAEVYG